MGRDLGTAFRAVAEAAQAAGAAAAEALNRWAREVSLRPHRPVDVGEPGNPMPHCLTCNVSWPCSEFARLSGEGDPS